MLRLDYVSYVAFELQINVRKWRKKVLSVNGFLLYVAKKKVQRHGRVMFSTLSWHCNRLHYTTTLAALAQDFPRCQPCGWLTLSYNNTRATGSHAMCSHVAVSNTPRSLERGWNRYLPSSARTFDRPAARGSATSSSTRLLLNLCPNDFNWLFLNWVSSLIDQLSWWVPGAGF